jgi:transcriptional regulator with XRE-family HTH domain
MSKAQKVFGQNLKAFRKKTCMTQPQLAKASNVATSIVNDVENGIRTAGIKTLNNIAQGLELTEEDRFVFLLNGLRLSKRDFLIPDFKDYPPEILNFLPFALLKTGVSSSEINEITVSKGQSKSLQVHLKSGKTFSIEIRLSSGKPTPS